MVALIIIVILLLSLPGKRGLCWANALKFEATTTDKMQSA